MKVKEESEKIGLKLNIQKTKIMASRPTTSWEIDGKTVEIVSDFIFWGSKINVDGDCSHHLIEIKRCLLLGSKVMTKTINQCSYDWYKEGQVCKCMPYRTSQLRQRKILWIFYNFNDLRIGHMRNHTIIYLSLYKSYLKIK